MILSIIFQIILLSFRYREVNIVVSKENHVIFPNSDTPLPLEIETLILKIKGRDTLLRAKIPFKIKVGTVNLTV